MNHSILRAAALVVVMAPFACQSVEATVITLTSGENTGGWVAPAPANLVYAGDAYAFFGNDTTIQGILFKSFRTDGYGGTLIPAGDSLVVPGGGASGPGGLSLGGSTNDINMAGMASSFYYSTSGGIVLTLGNLTPSASYRLDLFTFSTDSQPTTTISTVGQSTVTDNVTITGGTAYVVEETLAASSLGQLVTTFTGSGSRFSGFALSAIPVPEPSTFALIGVGTVGLLAASGRRRRC